MGAANSLLTEEQIQSIRQKTPLTDLEMTKLLKRYVACDSSGNGTGGIPFQAVLQFPEFVGHPLVSKILQRYGDKTKHRIFPEEYLYFVCALSSKAPVAVKKKVLFRSLDVHGTGCLEYDDIYQLYKALFDKSLTDDQILQLTFQCLHDLDLSSPGQLSLEEFNRLIPDGEIANRMTVDLQLPP